MLPVASLSRWTNEEKRLFKPLLQRYNSLNIFIHYFNSFQLGQTLHVKLEDERRNSSSSLSRLSLDILLFGPMQNVQELQFLIIATISSVERIQSCHLA